MKRYISVWMLLARSTVYKMLAILLGTAAAHTVAFYLLKPGRTLERVFDHPAMQVIFGAGLVLLTLLLVSTLSESGGKLDYTLRRLRVGHRTLFVSQCVYNVACCLIFWAAEVLTVFALCRVWEAGQEEISHQLVYLAFYRSEFLHGLLPLDEGICYVRNLALFVAVAVCAACGPVLQRRGQQHLGMLLPAIVFAVAVPSELGRVGIGVGIACAGVIFAFGAAIVTWGEEFRNED